jgi:hypothetical protein
MKFKAHILSIHLRNLVLAMEWEKGYGTEHGFSSEHIHNQGTQKDD